MGSLYAQINFAESRLEENLWFSKLEKCVILVGHYVFTNIKQPTTVYYFHFFPMLFIDESKFSG